MWKFLPLLKEKSAVTICILICEKFLLIDSDLLLIRILYV